MNSETKVVGIIGIITLIIIVGGLWLAGKSTTGNNGANGQNMTINPDTLVRPDSPRLTGKNAGADAVNPKKVQIVEFGDLECPACAVLNPELKKLLASDGDNIDFVVRFIPIHAHSKQAAAAALAAGEQGKFFEMYDIIFENQAAWTAYGADINKLFDSYATEIGLDINKYHADLSANQTKYYALVDRDGADAAATGVNSTPTLIFNGKTVLRGSFPYEKLKSTLDELVNETAASSSSAQQ